MATISSTSIIQALISKSPAAKKTADMTQVKLQLNKLLQEAAEFIRQYIIAQAQVGHKNKFKQGGSFEKQTDVDFDLTKGLSVDLPDFADDLDKGRKPGTYPPAAAILAWVKQYNITARSGGKAGRISVNQLVFLIQRAIFKNGVKAKPFIKNAEDFAEKLAGDIAEQIILPSLVEPLVQDFNKK